MRFLQAEKIKAIINTLTLMTMEGEVYWASVDLLDIQAEISDKDNLINAFQELKEKIEENILRDVKFLALKGYGEERIDKAIARRRARVCELDKRIEFARKTRQRLINRAERFDLNLSRGWYIDFTIEESTQRQREYPLRLIIRRKEQADEGIAYEGGITFAAKDDSVAIDNFVDSGEYPVIYTLGILLKKEGRVVKKPKQVYKLNLTGV